MHRRDIKFEWVEHVLNNPSIELDDEDDPEVRHYLAPISEFGSRVLRVIINIEVEPVAVVTVYFDRRMKGKL